jgi:D-alanine-D-alanine ligase-like ATP-grasp enzyme
MRHVALDSNALRGPVAVLMGGMSAEREVSLDSGHAVHAALARRLPDAIAIDVGADVLSQLISFGIAHVFIALHGRGGEDGAMQGALQTLGISYTGSGVLACALAMDKLRCKRFWQAEGVPTPRFEIARAGLGYEEIAARIGPRLFVKPACEGSSIGISVAEDAEQLNRAIELATQYDAALDPPRNAAHLLRLRGEVSARHHALSVSLGARCKRRSGDCPPRRTRVPQHRRQWLGTRRHHA